MNSGDMQRIQHIKSYCEDINQSIDRFGNKFNVFIKDKDYFNSVSMCLMQIGELSGTLSEQFKEETKNQIQWVAIRGMRNIFAHAYISIDKNIIWETATRNVPELLEFCNKIINSN